MARISAAQAKAMGIQVNRHSSPLGNGRESKTGLIKSRQEKRSAAEVERVRREEAFNLRCDNFGIPRPDFEYEFAKEIGRKWRFDFLFEGWLAVEKVGGVWTRGHHSRGKDQIDDMEKKNHAVLMGYSILEFTPSQFDSGDAFAFIKRVLDAGEENQP